MNYDQEEKFKELKNYISTHTINRSINYVDQAALEENFKWNAALFFAKAIHLAKPMEQELTLKEFNLFKKNYEERSFKQIDTEALFQKYWLRNVLGKIKIAGTVSSACHTFSGISNFKSELKFLLEEFNEGNEGKEKISKKDFDQIRYKYEKDNNLTLSDEGLYRSKWLSESNDKIDISNINFYFKPYLDHWEVFEFLTAYKERIIRYEDKGLKIDKGEFQALHQSFSQFYTQTPSIENLIKQKLLQEKEESYYLDFHNVKISYWSSLNNQITAFYWQLLIEDNGFSDDQERVKRLLRQILYWEWSSDFLSYSIDESKKRFLDAACNLVINEPDLEGIDEEFRKVSIDGEFGSREIQLLFQSREEYDDFSLNNTDHFELFESLDNWEKKAHTTYLQGQNSRKEITFLIKVIIAHDYKFEREDSEIQDNPITYYYKRVFALLEKSITRPTLLWDIKCFVIMCRREFIPYLIKRYEYTSLTFQFIDKLIKDHIPKEEKELFSKKLWTKSLELALFTIRLVVQNGVASLLIFQIYRQLNSRKYNIPYNRQKHTKKLSRKQNEEKEKAVLSLIEDCSLQNESVHRESNQFLFPELFNEMVQLFINLPSKSLYNNGTVNFPMLQWDGLTWLMKCSTYWKYKSQFNIKPSDVNTLTNSFFKLYIGCIEVTEVNKYNFSEKREEKGLPLWSEKIERLEYIEWIYSIYFIYKQQKLNSFLEPRFYFDPTSEFYHKENHFTADKLRTHLGVLLQVLRQLVLPIIPYGFEKDEILEIKLKVERQIIDYLKWHIKDLPKEGRVDLFDYNKERAFRTSEKEALLPQVARALNWFSQKEQIIEAIIETQDIVKILTIAKWVTSVGVKQKLIEKIQESDIKAFLKKRWTPEIQQVLLDISQYPKLEKEIIQLVEFWEKNISNINREYEVQLYQTKMLLAYFQNDESQLHNIKEPSISNHSVRELSYRDHKQFYRALIRLENNPESSHAIFSQLSTHYPQYHVFALNQMAAKINMAKVYDDSKIYKEALEEWKVYASQHKELEEDELGAVFLTNKLFILLKIRQYNELDTVFSELEMPYQMLPDVLDSKVESLIERNWIEQANILLEEAERYHQFLGDEGFEFIKALRVKVGGINDIHILNAYYKRIFDSPPSKLIEIFPENINGNKVVGAFLTKEVAIAASKMLDKVVSISDIKGEDKYNDIVELSLDSRINTWGWYIGAQSRGAFSDPNNKTIKKQPGERDLPIHDSNKELFCICEAFVYRTPAPAKSHLKKILNYHHQKENLIILVYDLNPRNKSKKNWKKYISTIIPNTDFPSGFEFKTVEDVTLEFNYQNSAIRIARSIHKSETVIYHVFVNVNYFVG
ncbi:MAG: hypothetical protein R8N23_06655 [Reichenbachiella sp.]|uniref:hypothetical protein n=1 Tax=Reichenbachiella sp. TaxID=2184521 RepID=UPI002966B9EF|nr:hypothetical protein [Reichenbachiella sp.]MDW3209525.1 hypothetical protein [Reichenbachiella sp.]